MPKSIVAAALLLLAAPATHAAPAPDTLLVSVRCEGPAALGCVLGAAGQAWTLDPLAGRRMLSEHFFLELENRPPAEWRDFTFSLPLDAERTGVRLGAGDRVFFNLPTHLNEEQFFGCHPVLPLAPGTALAECTPLTFVDQILPECVKEAGTTGLRCMAGPPLLLGRDPAG